MIINGFYVNTNVSSYVLTNLHQTDLCDVDGTYMNLPLKIMITSNINMLEMTLSWRDIYTVLTDLWFGLWI